jgi:hypothetical protein
MTPAVERGQWVKVVFERCDDFTMMPGVNKDQVWALEKRLLETSDAVTYVHEGLMERERGLVKQSVFVGHGVDFDQFVAVRPTYHERTPIPSSMRHLTKPLVGFYGGLDEYRMDVELMIKIARHIAPATLVLIGPAQMDLSRILAENNVVHIPQLSPAELAVHAAHFEVGTIPFLQNEFNQMCNPIKLKEYLALGFPTVAMMLPAFKPYHSLIYLANSHQEFLDQLDIALQERDVTLFEKRRLAVAESRWQKIALQVAELLSIHISKKES